MTIYTPQETSRLLAVPASTIRRWAKRFSHRLSDGGQRRKRLYTDRDLDLFARIRTLTDQGRTLDWIDQHLGETVPQGDIVRRPGTLPGLLREIDLVNDTLSDHDTQMRMLRERLEKLEAEARIPWYKRPFRRG